MIETPLADVESWVTFFEAHPLPVLRHSRRQLDEMQTRIDNVSAREVAQLVLQDPVLSARVLAYIQPLRGKRLQHDITTIASAIMMSGIEPFFRRFGELPTIENNLKTASPQAWLGVMQVVRRSQRAADYAWDWAVWRHDINAEEVRLAALLHDLAEILIWCFAPQLALKIRSLLVNTPGMRSVAAQREVLGFPVLELQQALCHAWHLPELLKQLMDDEHTETFRSKNVILAVRLARHSAHSWNDPALPDDYKEIGELLHLLPETVMQRVGVPPPEPAASAQPETTPPPPAA